MTSIKRTVFYYKVFNPDGALAFGKKLKKVCSIKEGEREYTHQDVTVNIQITESGEEDKIVIAGVVRLLRYVAPSVGTKGTNSSVPIPLKENEGVNEKTHFVYSPAKNVIAVEYNHYGPKVSLLFRMVNEIYRSNFDQESKRNSYIYITNGNGWAKVRGSNGIRRVHLEYVEEPMEADGESSSLIAAYRNALRVGETKSAEIILKPAKHSHNPIMTGLELIKNIMPKNGSVDGLDLSGFSKLEVKYENETGGVDDINLIHDKLSQDFIALAFQEGSKEINTDHLLGEMTEDLQERDFKVGAI